MLHKSQGEVYLCGQCAFDPVVWLYMYPWLNVKQHWCTFMSLAFSVFVRVCVWGPLGDPIGLKPGHTGPRVSWNHLHVEWLFASPWTERSLSSFNGTIITSEEFNNCTKFKLKYFGLLCPGDRADRGTRARPPSPLSPAEPTDTVF